MLAWYLILTGLVELELMELELEEEVVEVVVVVKA